MDNLKGWQQALSVLDQVESGTPPSSADLKAARATLVAAIGKEEPNPTWLQHGALVYRLTDHHRPQNFDEISVTMADGSRDQTLRNVLATRVRELLTKDDEVVDRETTRQLVSDAIRNITRQSHNWSGWPGTVPIAEVVLSALEYRGLHLRQVQKSCYAPYLVDRADGVAGHYAIGRWHPEGFQEVWNFRTHRWTSASDDVLTLEAATKVLKELIFSTPVAK